VTVVVDASVILALLLPDEDSALGERLFTDPELKRRRLPPTTRSI
jgi:predicted nucleic acid-binding protein